jgi:hypothetical protein
MHGLKILPIKIELFLQYRLVIAENSGDAKEIEEVKRSRNEWQKSLESARSIKWQCQIGSIK